MEAGLGKEAAYRRSTDSHIRVDKRVKMELHDFVTRIASLYHKFPFHNFERASHVAMTVNNLMERVVVRGRMERAKIGGARKSTFGMISARIH